MQAMIGKDAVLLIINHRIGSCRNDLRMGNCNATALNAQISVLEEIKGQLDFLLPVEIPGRVEDTVIILKA